MTMNVTLNNGVQMPALGFGVFQTPPDVTAQAVGTALAAGYRLDRRRPTARPRRR